MIGDHRRAVANDCTNVFSSYVNHLLIGISARVTYNQQIGTLAGVEAADIGQS
ncbi:MAG: hypothetical protein M3R61_15420 [Chloroflexota bacterium]|nr:hypothetical protein [Chloroflexota bacterium]